MTAREVAAHIISEMEETSHNPTAARHYRRLAIIDYARAFKRSPFCTAEETRRAFQDAAFFVEKAIRVGANQESLEESLSLIAHHWTKVLNVHKGV